MRLWEDRAVNADQPPYPAWMYRQSAALPYRRAGATIEVLLVTSRKGKRWIAPKGIVEPGLSPAESAAKEAAEEAGVVGEMSAQPLGSYRYEKWGGICQVAVYALAVQEQMTDWPESGFRRRRWQPLAAAMLQVNDPGLRAVMARLATAADDDSSPEVPLRRSEAPRLLYLLRHAKAAPAVAGLDDAQRPLTSAGAADADRMRRYVAVADIRPAVVLCSTALRARQSLDRIGPALGGQATTTHLPDLYGAATQDVVDLLRTTPPGAGSVMVVGHNPGLHTLAMDLTRGDEGSEREQLAMKLPAGALATLVFRGASWHDLGAGTCELHSLVRPRDIRADQ